MRNMVTNTDIGAGGGSRNAQLSTQAAPAGPDGSKERPWTTNAQVKTAKPGDYVVHKGQVIPLKQADIDWANGIRPSAQPKTPQQAAETAVKTEAAQDPNMSIAKAQQIEKEAKDQVVMNSVVDSSRTAKSNYEAAKQKYDTLLAQLQAAEDELMQAADEYNSHYEGGENSYDTKRAEASGVNVGNIAQAVNGKY